MVFAALKNILYLFAMLKEHFMEIFVSALLCGIFLLLLFMVFEQFSYRTKRSLQSRRLRPRNARASVTRSSMGQQGKTTVLNQSLKQRLLRCSSLALLPRGIFWHFWTRFKLFVWFMVVAPPMFIIRSLVRLVRPKRQPAPVASNLDRGVIIHAHDISPCPEIPKQRVNHDESFPSELKDNYDEFEQPENVTLSDDDKQQEPVQSASIKTPLTPISILSEDGEPAVQKERTAQDDGLSPQHPEVETLVPGRQISASLSPTKMVPTQAPAHGKYMDYWKKLGLININNPATADQRTTGQGSSNQPRKNSFAFNQPKLSAEGAKYRRNSYSTGTCQPNYQQCPNQSWGHQRNNPFAARRQEGLYPRVPDDWRITGEQPTHPEQMNQPHRQDLHNIPANFSFTKSSTNERLYSIFDSPFNMLDSLDTEHFFSTSTWNWTNQPSLLPTKNVFAAQPGQNAAHQERIENSYPITNAVQPSGQNHVTAVNWDAESRHRCTVIPGPTLNRFAGTDELSSYAQFQEEFVAPNHRE